MTLKETRVIQHKRINKEYKHLTNELKEILVNFQHTVKCHF